MKRSKGQSNSEATDVQVDYINHAIFEKNVHSEKFGHFLNDVESH